MQKFLPYWKYPQLTNLDPTKFKVSAWYNKKQNKGMLCIASLSNEPVTVPISLGKDWKFKDLTKLGDACKESLEGDEVVQDWWKQTSPSGQTSIVGDYAYYTSEDKLGAVYDENNGTAVFKPYGVLMLHVK